MARPSTTSSSVRPVRPLSATTSPPSACTSYRLQAYGRGETEPLPGIPGTSPDNRRVEIAIYAERAVPPGSRERVRDWLIRRSSSYRPRPVSSRPPIAPIGGRFLSHRPPCRLPMSPTSPDETPFDADKKMSLREQAEWQATRIKDTWRIFRIMGEFVEGFERALAVRAQRLGLRLGPDEAGHALLRDGRRDGHEARSSTATRSSPVAARASWRPPTRARRRPAGVSVGLNIALPHEQRANPYVDPDWISTSTTSSRAR